MSKWSTRIIVVLMMAIGVGAIAASPAHAAWDGCPVGAVCLYNDPGGVGLLHVIPAQPAGTCYSGIPASANDKTDSYWNRTVRSISLYSHTNCQGERLAGPQAQTAGQGLTLTLPRSRNRTSSVFFHTDG